MGTHFSTVSQIMKTVLALLAFLAIASSERVTYDGYKVLRTQHLNMTTSKALQSLQLEDVFDFWQDPVIGRSADIMASPEMLSELQQILSKNGIHYTVMVEDVEELHRGNERPETRRSGYDWEDYHSHSDINDFIDGLGASNSDWVATKSIGQTYEGRDMRVIEITKAGPGKPIAWIEAGIHAREWIASATATFMINELVNNYEQNKDIVDNLNIHFIPMANPDGYEYSRISDRMWRKNRNPSPGRDSTKACKGVDLNRNWGYHWGEAGVSHNSCSDIYCGTGPFSELESQNIKNYVEALNPSTAILNYGFGLMVMLTMHTLQTRLKLKNLPKMPLMLYIKFMELSLIQSTLQNFTLLLELLMIGTEGVLEPDIPSQLNLEALDTTDLFCLQNKLFLAEKNSLLE